MNGVSYRVQRGFTLTKLLMISVVAGVVALLAMKLVPEYIEYYKIKTGVLAVAQEANSNPNATVPDIRRAFERHAEIDHLKNFEARDLDISKDGNRVVIEFAYERKVHLIKNISVLIEFSGSSAD
jgi:hypothetical protein